MSEPKPPFMSNMNRKRLMIIMVVILVPSIAAVIYAIVKVVSNRDSHSNGAASTFRIKHTCKHPNSSYDYDNKNVVLPFSFCDPVHDLGLWGILRREPSSPPPVFQNRTSNEDYMLDIEYGRQKSPLPTNKWYQNMLLLQGNDEPTIVQNAYTIPYLIDVVSQIPGLRIHPIYLDATASKVQASKIEHYALTLGIAEDSNNAQADNTLFTRRYSIVSTSDLGLTLEWDAYPMVSSIVRGMPYATMIYNDLNQGGGDNDDSSKQKLLPTILSEIRLRDSPKADNDDTKIIICSSDNNNLQRYLVQREIEMTFEESDFTWLVFFSEPAWVQCYIDDDSGTTMLQVMERASNNNNNTQNQQENGQQPFVTRVALMDPCTTASNILFCDSALKDTLIGRGNYSALLRQYAHSYPGQNTNVDFHVNHEKNNANLTLNFDPQKIPSSLANSSSHEADSLGDLIMFALPHHLDLLDPTVFPGGDGTANARYCMPSLTGPACLVVGSSWTLLEEQLPHTSLRAPRHPKPQFFPSIAESLRNDIQFTVPDIFARGGGDTYFSGKMLAKHGRILIVAEEMIQLCHNQKSEGNIRQSGTFLQGEDSNNNEEYEEVCQNIDLPTPTNFSRSLNTFRDAVEIWINSDDAETPFVYDSKWGGVISCGCTFNEENHTCENRVPDCPAFEDQTLNFGNGFYNDHHFHYGYHIYAAAIVAHFDPIWGRDNFERILLLIRDIANPSNEDPYFPTFRHKDWYLGSSWASGITLPPFPDGPNQESSSEAIAAYESIAVYGNVMVSAWEEIDDHEKAHVAKNIQNIGRLLTVTELRSTKRYWHVHQKDESLQVYPRAYQQNIVGTLFSTKVEYDTWFGTAPYHIYGIQLIPLTPISEARDSIDWVKEMHPNFLATCSSDELCEKTGWSIIMWASMALIGDRSVAAEQVKRINPEAFDSAGGNGHSLSNTLWYIATRPNSEKSDEEVTMSNEALDDGEVLSYEAPNGEVVDQEPSDEAQGGEEVQDGEEASITAQSTGQPPSIEVPVNDKMLDNDAIDCTRPDSCNSGVLQMMAGSHSCLDRILWLINSSGKTQYEACFQIAALEHPNECGPCNPDASAGESTPNETNVNAVSTDGNQSTGDPPCPPCSDAQCESFLCPAGPYHVCTDGANKNGCSLEPWSDTFYCAACCERTSCPV